MREKKFTVFMIGLITLLSPMASSWAQVPPLSCEELMVIPSGYHLPSAFTENYYRRRIESRLRKPDYASVANPTRYYRGMFLTPDEFKNVIENGMKLNLVRHQALGGGISFSSNIHEASDYIFQSADSRSHGIGVVFETAAIDGMTFIEDEVLNSTRTIFKLYRDLKADEIQNVYLWGEYGLESLASIRQKIKEGTLKPHPQWTGVFDSGFSR